MENENKMPQKATVFFQCRCKAFDERFAEKGLEMEIELIYTKVFFLSVCAKNYDIDCNICWINLFYSAVRCN